MSTLELTTLVCAFLSPTPHIQWCEGVFRVDPFIMYPPSLLRGMGIKVLATYPEYVRTPSRKAIQHVAIEFPSVCYPGTRKFPFAYVQ